MLRAVPIGTSPEWFGIDRGGDNSGCRFRTQVGSLPRLLRDRPTSCAFARSSAYARPCGDFRISLRARRTFARLFLFMIVQAISPCVNPWLSDQVAERRLVLPPSEQMLRPEVADDSADHRSGRCSNRVRFALRAGQVQATLPVACVCFQTSVRSRHGSLVRVLRHPGKSQQPKNHCSALAPFLADRHRRGHKGATSMARP